jgi:hypothetical protein
LEEKLMTDSALISACETHFPGGNSMISVEAFTDDRADEKARAESPIWQRAEDSFLKFFCRIERFEWGSFYFWDEGQDWPKFNFIRLMGSAVTVDGFNRHVAKYRPYFEQRGRTFSAKIPDGVAVPPEVSQRFKPAGIPLVSLKFDPRRLKPSPTSDVRLCKSEDDVALWWDINSDGRSRQDPKQSPLWPVVLDAFQAGTRYYILYKDGQSVSGAALTPFNNGRDFNLWGLATRKEHLKKGYIKELVASVGSAIGVPYYLQVNIDTISHQMFKRLGAEELIIERRYELA